MSTWVFVATSAHDHFAPSPSCATILPCQPVITVQSNWSDRSRRARLDDQRLSGLYAADERSRISATPAGITSTEPLLLRLSTSTSVTSPISVSQQSIRIGTEATTTPPSSTTITCSRCSRCRHLHAIYSASEKEHGTCRRSAESQRTCHHVQQGWWHNDTPYATAPISVIAGKVVRWCQSQWNGSEQTSGWQD